ncbi:procathepsin L-like [Carcharodon carcharias]|uniref:procathepsin L-like n=1 Tax=Carcharodon carcharias TaxID=13397 RepID=UPI001B7E2175|nr:procathepsin L-like [Carcharodon carcharias]
MVFFLVVTYILTVISMASTNPIIDEKWESWKQEYGKSYPNQARREIWLDNLEKIEAHNAQYRHGNSMYEMAMNRFGDLTPMEFEHLFTDARISEMANYTEVALSDFGGTGRNHQILDEMEDLAHFPKDVDWRRMGYVSNVKNQGYCLSCYAFTAVGALEGQLARKTNQLVDLSVQNIIDCSDGYKNYGCNGGLPYRAFEYVRDHGIQSDQSYPYQAKRNNECLFNSSKSVTKVRGFRRIKNYTEKELAALVANVGPISVLIRSSHDSFKFYKSGIFENVDCNSKKIDHSVLVVGYVDEHPKGYWIIKNRNEVTILETYHTIQKPIRDCQSSGSEELSTKAVAMQPKYKIRLKNLIEEVSLGLKQSTEFMLEVDQS